MTDRRLNIKVAFSALNNMSNPVNAARNAAAGLAAQIKATQNNIKSLGRSASSFDKLNAATKRTANEITQAKEKARQMAAAFGPLKGRTAEQTAALIQQRAAIRQLTQQQGQQQARLSTLRAELYRHGVSVDRNGKATDQINQRTTRYNQLLAEQQRRLNSVSQAQASYARTQELSSKLKSGGMMAAIAGAAVLAPVTGTIVSYSKLEDAMKGVTKQVDGLRDSEGKRTDRYYEMQSAIKKASEQLPQASGAIDYAALVEGGARMGVAKSGDPWEKQKKDLLTFANTSAMASKAFELPAGELAESMGKIASLYQIPISDIESLGDAINYLDDNAQSKGSDIINVLQRMGGYADKLDYKKAAALGSTFLSLGAGAEVAATASNAMIRELSNATIQGNKFQDALSILGISAKSIEEGMTEDAMGTIIKVLDKAKNLPKSKQTPILTLLFGDEFGDDAAKLANNLPELRRQIELLQGSAAKGSMRKESDIDLNSLSSQWLLLKANAANTFSSLGETLREPLLEMMTSAQKMLQAFRKWVENNKELAGTLMKIVAGAGAALVAFGTMAAGVGAVLGPIASVKLSLSTLMEGTSIGGLLSGLLDLHGMLGGLIGPIQAVGSCLSAVFGPLIGVIAGISAPIWALIAVIVIAAIAIIKFWEPIKAFFSGFFSGLISGLQPVISAFSWLSPLFDSIATKIGVVWEWFTKLFEPVNYSTEELNNCTSAGQRFGELVGKALTGLFSVITAVAKGIGWLLEKLGAIPSAAEAAQQVANTMQPAAVSNAANLLLPAVTATLSTKKKNKEPKLTKEQSDKLDSIGGRKIKGSGGGSGGLSNSTQERRDPNKLGDIVFKNVPAYMPIRGGYAEPMIQARNSVSPYSVKPPTAYSPPAAQSGSSVLPGQSDIYNINITITDARNMDEGKIAKRVRAEVEALQLAADRRRRSSLLDRG